MSKIDQDQLWEGYSQRKLVDFLCSLFDVPFGLMCPFALFLKDNYAKFWNVNAQLVALDDPAVVRGVPFRIYLPDSPLIQKVLPPVKASGLLLFLSFQCCPLFDGLIFTATTGKLETLEGLLREAVPQLFEGDKVPKVVTHGVSPPLSTPLAWLGENMSYPDNFLHLVVSA